MAPCIIPMGLGGLWPLPEAKRVLGSNASLVFLTQRQSSHWGEGVCMCVDRTTGRRGTPPFHSRGASCLHLLCHFTLQSKELLAQGAGLFPPPPPQFLSSHPPVNSGNHHTSFCYHLWKPLQIHTNGSFLHPKGWLWCQNYLSGEGAEALQNLKKAEHIYVALQIPESMYTPHLVLLASNINQSFQNFYFVFDKLFSVI